MTATITVTAPPGKLGLELGPSGVVFSVLTHCALESIGLYDYILEVNGKTLTGLHPDDIMRLFASISNEPKILTVQKAKRHIRAVSLTSPQPTITKRKVFGKIQSNGVIITTTKKSKISPLNSPAFSPECASPTKTKQEVEPLVDRCFPKLASISPPRELSEAQARSKMEELDPLIHVAAINVREKEQKVQSLRRQLKEAELQLEAFKSEKKHLERCRDRAQNDAVSDAHKILEKSKGITTQSEEAAITLVQDICNLFRTSGESPTPEMTVCFNQLIKTLCAKGNKGIEGAIQYLLRSAQSWSPIGIEERALESFFRVYLSDPNIPQPTAPYRLIAEAIVQVGSPEDIARLVQSVIVTSQAMKKVAGRNQHKNIFGFSNRYLVRDEIPRCPILDVMQPTLEILKTQTKAERTTLEPLRTALKVALMQSLSAKENYEPNYAMPVEADIAEKAGNKRLAMFLRSPTLRSARLDYNKKVQIMMIKRTIDQQLPFPCSSKIQYETTKGSGSDRVLVVTKLEQSKLGLYPWQQDRKQRHKQLLLTMRGEDLAYNAKS